jgi:hypothetical protein
MYFDFSRQRRVPRKMSEAAFVANNRGIDGGADLSSDLLVSVYRRIQAHPIRMDDDDMFEAEVSTFVAPLQSGFLLKRGSLRGDYKKYWFVLTDGCLYYFQTRRDRTPKAIIPLENCECVASRSRADTLLLRGASLAVDGQKAKSSSISSALGRRRGGDTEGLRRGAPQVKSMKPSASGMKFSQHKELVFRTIEVDERSLWVAAFLEAIQSLEPYPEEASTTESATIKSKVAESTVNAAGLAPDSPGSPGSKSTDSARFSENNDDIGALRTGQTRHDTGTSLAFDNDEDNVSETASMRGIREDRKAEDRLTWFGGFIGPIDSRSRAFNDDSDDDDDSRSIRSSQSTISRGSTTLTNPRSPLSPNSGGISSSEPLTPGAAAGVALRGLAKEVNGRASSSRGVSSLAGTKRALAGSGGGEGRRLQDRVSASRARGLGDSELIVLERVASLVAAQDAQEQEADNLARVSQSLPPKGSSLDGSGGGGNSSTSRSMFNSAPSPNLTPGQLATCDRLLAVCDHVTSALASCSTVPPLKPRRRFQASKQLSTKETTAGSAPGNAEATVLTSSRMQPPSPTTPATPPGEESHNNANAAAKPSARGLSPRPGQRDPLEEWAKEADALGEKYQAQLVYNVDVLARVATFERAAYLCARIVRPNNSNSSGESALDNRGTGNNDSVIQAGNTTNIRSVQDGNRSASNRLPTPEEPSTPLYDGELSPGVAIAYSPHQSPSTPQAAPPPAPINPRSPPFSPPPLAPVSSNSNGASEEPLTPPLLKSDFKTRAPFTPAGSIGGRGHSDGRQSPGSPSAYYEEEGFMEARGINDESTADVGSSSSANDGGGMRVNASSVAVCEAYGDTEVGLHDGSGLSDLLSSSSSNNLSLSIISGDKGSSRNGNTFRSYRFDKVWGADASSAAVFRDMEPLLVGVVHGHSACLVGIGDEFTSNRSGTVLGARDRDVANDVDEEQNSKPIMGNENGDKEQKNLHGASPFSSSFDPESAVDFGLGFHAAAAVLHLLEEKAQSAAATRAVMRDGGLSTGATPDAIAGSTGDAKTNDKDHDVRAILSMVEIGRQGHMKDLLSAWAKIAPEAEARTVAGVTYVALDSAQQLARLYASAILARTNPAAGAHGTGPWATAAAAAAEAAEAQKTTAAGEPPVPGNNTAPAFSTNGDEQVGGQEQAGNVIMGLELRRGRQEVIGRLLVVDQAVYFDGSATALAAAARVPHLVRDAGGGAAHPGTLLAAPSLRALSAAITHLGVPTGSTSTNGENNHSGSSGSNSDSGTTNSDISASKISDSGSSSNSISSSNGDGSSSTAQSLLRGALGPGCVTVVLACLSGGLRALPHTKATLTYGRQVANQLPTASGATVIEALDVQSHMRLLRTRIASARQCAETLQADFDQLKLDLKQASRSSAKGGAKSVPLSTDAKALVKAALAATEGDDDNGSASMEASSLSSSPLSSSLTNNVVPIGAQRDSQQGSKSDNALLAPLVRAARLQRGMALQVALMVASLDSMAQHLNEDASQRDRHVATLNQLSQALQRLRNGQAWPSSSSSTDSRGGSGGGNEAWIAGSSSAGAGAAGVAEGAGASAAVLTPRAVRNALVEAQEAVEGTLREMHVSILDKVLAFNRHDKLGHLREQQQERAAAVGPLAPLPSSGAGAGGVGVGPAHRVSGGTGTSRLTGRLTVAAKQEAIIARPSSPRAPGLRRRPPAVNTAPLPRPGRPPSGGSSSSGRGGGGYHNSRGLSGSSSSGRGSSSGGSSFSGGSSGPGSRSLPRAPASARTPRLVERDRSPRAGRPPRSATEL